MFPFLLSVFELFIRHEKKKRPFPIHHIFNFARFNI